LTLSDGRPIVNTVLDIKRYLAQSGALDAKEFHEFWSSLTDEEKDDYKKTELK
jgi:hypothetical protein